MTLTIAFVTARHDPKVEWAINSLRRQVTDNDTLKRVIIVDHFWEKEPKKYFPLNAGSTTKGEIWIDSVLPKPTIWQGKDRLPEDEWWAKSNALNTAICLCETDWIAFCDDRCVLGPHWLEAVLNAMNGGYAVCGNYEKWANMQVTDGVITDSGTLLGTDTRDQDFHSTHRWYGGSCALPLEWCLMVNGWPELCDSVGLEDIMFGATLWLNGLPMYYDPKMLIIEDRTPGQIDGALKRANKGEAPNSKADKIVEIFLDKKTSQNSFDIRDMRARVLRGEPFPPPSASHLDWFDGSEIKDFT